MNGQKLEYEYHWRNIIIIIIFAVLLTIGSVLIIFGQSYHTVTNPIITDKIRNTTSSPITINI